MSSWMRDSSIRSPTTGTQVNRPINQSRDFARAAECSAASKCSAKDPYKFAFVKSANPLSDNSSSNTRKSSRA